MNRFSKPMRGLGLMLGVCLLACMSMSAQAATVVVNGQPKATILIKAGDDKYDRFSAEQLQAYVEKISGAKLPIVVSDEAPQGTVMIVGNHPLSASVVATLEERYPGNDEGFAVVAKDGNLHMVGQSEIATAWAVWDWLHAQGVRWLMPVPQGEYVPKDKTLAFPDGLKKFDAPALALRGPGYNLSEELGGSPLYAVESYGYKTANLYSYRQRNNFPNFGFAPGNGVRNIGAGHSYMWYLPASRYIKDHPEWFAIQDGKRGGTKPLSLNHWQVCYTNEEAAAQYARNIMVDVEKAVQEGFSQKRIQVCAEPNDAVSMCECENCQKLVDQDGSTTSMVFYFADRVAEHVHAKYPDVIIATYAYWDHTTVGNHVTPAKKVVPGLTMWAAAESTAANHAHPMMSDPNTRFRKIFNDWLKVTDAITVYAYYGHYNWFVPWPQMNNMAHDIPAMYKSGKFVGMYSESHLQWATQAPNFYLHNALMWNPDLNVREYMTDYFKAAHGPAGVAIQRHYDILEKQMNSIGYICGENVEILQLMTPETIALCNKQIDQARKLLGQMDEDTRWRTQVVIDGWECSVKYATAMRLALYPKSKEDRKIILKLVGEVRDYMKTDVGRFAFETRLAFPQMDRLEGPLKQALDELPLGETKWSASAMHGGAFNFWADVKGMTPGLWGYYMPPSGTGTFKLPLRAVEGGKFASAKVRFVGPDGGKATIDVTFSPSGQPSDKDVTIRTRPNELVEVPASVLGSRDLVITAKYTNHHYDPFTVLYAMGFDAVVE